MNRANRAHLPIVFWRATWRCHFDFVFEINCLFLFKIRTQLNGRSNHTSGLNLRRNGTSTAPQQRATSAHKSTLPGLESTGQVVDGFISRVLFCAWSPLRSDNHSSRANVAVCLKQPTRGLERVALCHLRFRKGDTPAYAALLPMGFSMPPTLPPTRWSLTPPFHPYLCFEKYRRSLFCGTILRVTATGRYPASHSLELGLSSRGAKIASPAIA